MLENKIQGKQKGSIGMALATDWKVPFTKSLMDQQAAQRVFDFRIGWYVRHAICKGFGFMKIKSLALLGFSQEHSK